MIDNDPRRNQQLGLALGSTIVASTQLNGGTENLRFASSADTVLARLNYKFDWAPLR